MKSYQKIKLLLSTSILCLFFVNPMTAVAGPCDALTGKAMGLCMAATDGMKCNTDEPSGSDKACARIEKQIIDSGEEVPWVCPAYTTESIVATYYAFPTKINRVTFSNVTPDYAGNDLSLIALDSDGGEYWSNLYTGLSQYISAGDYLSNIYDYTGVENRPIFMSQAQSDACRVEMKNAFDAISNAACTTGSEYPRSCDTFLIYCENDVMKTNAGEILIDISICGDLPKVKF